MKTAILVGFLLATCSHLVASSANVQPITSLRQLSVSQNVESSDVEEPEGGTAPLVPQHVVKWSSKSKLPDFVQWFLAGVWVAMLCALPFIIRSLDGRPVTTTQIVIGVLTVVVLIGGFSLFTNIILFQSVHFDRIRPLTVVECIYFMAQVITTVGYGDITPAKIRGQVFVGLYVLGALFIIAMLISDLTKLLISKAQAYREQRALAASIAEDAANKDVPKSVLSLIAPPKPSLAPLLTALAVFGVLDLCWIMFFSLHPGEGKTTFQALYMSVITLSSVGFGYFTPVTEEGMIFGAFWMLFGWCSLVNVISQFTMLMVQLNDYERFCPKEGSQEALEALKEITGDKNQVTEADFLKFCLLQMKRVEKKDIDGALEAFDNLKPQNRTVSLASIEDSMKQGEPES